MQKFNLSEFESSESEWGQLVIGRERDIDIVTPKNIHDKVYRIIRGKRCKEQQSLLQEWASALQFPYYFGHNWSAFDECISDLSWLPGKEYVIFITNFEKVLLKNPSDLSIFLSLLKDAAQGWKDPTSQSISGRWTMESIPFHIVFHCEPQYKNICQKKLEEAKINVNIKALKPFDKIS